MLDLVGLTGKQLLTSRDLARPKRRRRHGEGAYEVRHVGEMDLIFVDVDVDDDYRADDDDGGDHGGDDDGDDV